MGQSIHAMLNFKHLECYHLVVSGKPGMGSRESEHDQVIKLQSLALHVIASPDAQAASRPEKLVRFLTAAYHDHGDWVVSEDARRCLLGLLQQRTDEVKARILVLFSFATSCIIIMVIGVFIRMVVFCLRAVIGYDDDELHCVPAWREGRDIR